MSGRYFGFDGRDDVAGQFEYGTVSRWDKDNPFVPHADFPTDEQILFANYGSWSYDGDAFVLFERDGTLYEVTGGHCSYYGLEGQWEPEETNWPALAMRKFSNDYFEPDALAAIYALIAKHTATP